MITFIIGKNSSDYDSSFKNTSLPLSLQFYHWIRYFLTVLHLLQMDDKIEMFISALSKLKSKKRQWYLLDETECRLQFYKNREEARTKDPLGYIELRNAGISLNTGENNQFVVLWVHIDF